MFQPEKADSFSSLRQILHHISQRRYRTYLAVGIAFLLLSTTWTSGSLSVRSAKQTRHDEFGSNSVSQRPSQSATNTSHLIPPNIWQIVLPKKQPFNGDEKSLVVDVRNLEHTASWLAMNADYTYTLVGQKGGDEFVRSRFSHNPTIIEAYSNLTNVGGVNSDFLRYLILGVEGGVYTDTDTVAIRPIDTWVPPSLRDKVRLIVGIEFDRRDGGPWADISHWVQFCQWTIAAAPGHPIFKKMVNRVLASIDDLSAAHGVPANQLHPESFEVMNSTGPAAWTDLVFEQLQEYEPSLNDTKDLSFMTEPKLYGDILILTIDGFGMGQVHSHSTNDGSIPEAALMKHLFQGSWRDD